MANQLKGLDAFQVLRSVYELTNNTLRVSVIDGSTGSGTGFEVIISHINDSIRLGDGTNFITSTNLASKYGLDVHIINASLPLPLNAATESTLANIDSKLNTLGQKPSATSVPVVIAGDQSQIPVNTIKLFDKMYDSGIQTYPTSVQEVITTYLGGLLGTPVQRVTITYSDSTKNDLINFQREYWNGLTWVIG